MKRSPACNQKAVASLFFFPLRKGEKTECFRSLGTDHLTFEGGRGVGDFEKNFLQALVIRKKLHAAQM